MDLQSAHQGYANQWPLAKLAAFLFFMLASGMLAGSLAFNAKALTFSIGAHSTIGSIG